MCPWLVRPRDFQTVNMIFLAQVEELSTLSNSVCNINAFMWSSQVTEDVSVSGYESMLNGVQSVIFSFFSTVGGLFCDPDFINTHKIRVLYHKVGLLS